MRDRTMASLLCAGLVLCAACPRAPARAHDGPFERRVVLEVDAPSDVALTDLNGDGHVDAVVAASRLHVLLGDGTGELREGGTVDAGANPAGLSFGDVNGDGVPDLAVANHETHQVTVLLGDGAGGLEPAPGSPITVALEPHPHAVVLADLDGDGRLDLLVDDRRGEAVLVLRGAGDGRFEQPGTAIPVGGDPYRGMVAADIDGDGALDLLTPNPRDVGVRLASGRGAAPAGGGGRQLALDEAPAAGGDRPLAFDEAPPVPAPGPFSLGVADLTGDGALDLVVASENDGFVRLFAGDGAGGFGPAEDSVAIAPSEGLAVATGDVNGDGVADAVVTSYTSPTVAIMLGGETIRRATVEATVNPWGLDLADMNGDGIDDPVIADQGAGRVYQFLSR
jgi:hypothetical protein